MSRTPTTAAGGLDPKTVRWIRVRVLVLGALFVPLFAILVWRAVHLQVVQAPALTDMARDQYVRPFTVAGRRGPIFDRRGQALAATVEVDSIFATRSDLPAPRRAAAARALGKALHLDPQRVSALLAENKSFVWLKRRATPQEVAAVKALELPFVGFVKEPRRFYPQRELAAHVLGFAGMDGEGLEGIELAYDELLKGRPQRVSGVRDAFGRAVLLDEAAPAEALRGASVTLTLDRAIQYAAEKALQAAVTRARAAAGMAVVLDPQTGELLAVANVPTFNPNEAGRYQKHALRNRALADQFEPGSTFKAFTVAAALDSGAVGRGELFDCENGRYAVGRKTIRDHESHGRIGLGRILQVSSNIGVVKVAERLGRERLQRYLRDFGFGHKPGLGLPGETRGSLPYPKADIALATQAFGQGLTASAVQIAAAYGALANGGVLMQPFLVSKVVDASGATVLERHPERVRQVVSPRTASELLQMLQGVVERGGTAPLARLDDYPVAGKTGTAQKVEPGTGRYSLDKRIASFVGVVPADNPRLVIGVWIDEPVGDVYGGLVAAPAFREIAQAALSHLGIPPSRPAALPPAHQPALRAAAGPPAVSPSAAAAPSLAGAGEGFIDDESAASERYAVVPDVRGRTARAAVAALSAAWLEPELSGSGMVLGQTPPAGATVQRGTRVSVRLAPPGEGPVALSSGAKDRGKPPPSKESSRSAGAL